MADAASGKVPIVECVVVSWRFLLDNWSRFLPAALAVSIVAALSPFAMGALLGGATVPAVYADALIKALCGIFFAAAVLRYAVRKEFTGPGGLGFGVDETRLIGVFATLTLLFTPLAFMAGIAWAVSIIGSLGLTTEQLEAQAKDPAAFNEMIREAMARPWDSTVVVF